MPSSIPALSVRQPWAELIVSGQKTIEVRSWTTQYRGTFWLHTGNAVDTAAAQAGGLDHLYTGGYVGCVNLVAVVSFDASRWEMWRGKHLIDGPYRSGQFAWLLDAPRRFRVPVKGPGSLGLFRPRELVLAQLALSLKPEDSAPT